jgi:hypothetical protein
MKLESVSLGILFGAAMVIAMLWSFKPVYIASGLPYNDSSYVPFERAMGNISDMGAQTYAIYTNLTMKQSSVFGSVLIWTNLLINGPLTALKLVFVTIPTAAKDIVVGVISTFGMEGTTGNMGGFLFGLAAAAIAIFIVFTGWKIFFGGEG